MDPTTLPHLEYEGEPSELEHEALYTILKDWFRADADHSSEWRKQARQDFDFVAGHQWDPADKRYLEDQGRPVITFNRALTIIKAVAGIEINSRHETIYLPRGTQPGVVKANELLTAASQWMADGCDAEDEQSEAFQDALVCGMGWTEARVDYEEEPDGKYAEEKLDPLEMYWDRSARAKNLVDARRLFRVRKMTLADARDLFPEVPVSELNAEWAAGDFGELPKPVEDRRKREENSSYWDPKAEVHIVHAQWREQEPFYRVADPMSGQELHLTEDEFETYKQRMTELSSTIDEFGNPAPIEFTYVRQYRRVYKQAFLGASILGEVKPGPCKDRFSWSCITGERDRNKGTWFGLIRLMADPQRWANKWLSQTLHILNTTAKGGILAEEDAFKDQREAQETYAQPDAITFVKKEAISKGKIMQKPGAGIPTGYINLLEFAITSIRDVTGVNMELIGLRDANQPGILEAQRKQAGMTILATMFDSLRRFRKNVGRIRLDFIQSYFADGRLIRIAGEDGMQLVPLLQEQVLGDYEVIVDDAPTSPNSREQTWSALQMILPFFKEMITPEIALTALEYSPLPTKFVEQLKEIAKKPNPEAETQKQIGQEAAIAKIEKDKASAQRDLAAAQKDLATAGVQNAQTQLDLAQAYADNARADAQQAKATLDRVRTTKELLQGIGSEMAIDPTPSDGPELPSIPTVPPVPRSRR